MSTNQLFSKIFKKSIFELFPNLKDLAFSEGQVRVYPPNTVIAAKGSIPTELIIPLDNELKMENERSVTFLKIGRSLSLNNLLFQTPVEFEFSTVEKTRVFSLPAEVLNKYLDQNPVHKKYLHNITSCAGCRSLRKYLEDKNISKDNVIKLVSQARDEDSLSIQQSLDGKLILVSAGEINFNIDDPSYMMNDRLATGTFFGNSFLNPSFRRPYSIKSMGGKFKTISIESFKEVLGKTFDYDSLISEPFLKLTIVKLVFDFTSYETNTELPGSKVEHQEISDYFESNFPLHKAITVKNDFESIHASIYHALIYFGREVTMDSIKASVVFSGHRLSSSAIANIFFEHEVETLNVKFQPEHLHEFNSPFLFFVGNKFVFCFGKFKHGFLVLDPVYGFRILTEADFANLSWSGDIILVRSNVFHYFKTGSNPKGNESEQEISQHKVKGVMKIITSMVTEDKKFLYKVIACSLLIFGIDILVPKVSELLLDEVLKTNDNITLVSLVILMSFLYLCSVALTYFRTFFINSWGLKFSDKLTSSIVSVIFSKKTFTGKKSRIGDIISRFGEIDQIRNFFGSETVTTAINLFSAITYVIILFTYSAKIALIPVGFLVLILFLQFVIKKKMRVHYHKSFDLGIKKQGFLSEVISSMATVKAFNYEKKLSQDWDETLAATSEEEKAIANLRSVSTSLTSFLNQTLYLVTMWAGVYILLDGKAEFTPGEFFAMSQYISKLLGPLNSLVGFFTQYEDVKVSINKISDLIPLETQRVISFKQSIKLNGKVKLNNIFFKYTQDGPHILRNINLTLYPNQKVAIVGPSGSGKTTIANIIAGIEKPSSGEIFYDDVDSDAISESILKSQIGYIRQQNDLLSGSLESNIAFTDSSPYLEALERASYLSGSLSFIDEFPQRFKTELAEGGIGLSGGQKQRIAIARSIYMDPKILIFDEATSALDSESESFLLSKIDELCKDKTTVIIAHRLSTIRRADVIICVDQGEIVQVGNHSELISVQGLYRDLFLDQSGGD
jgi:ABC-type bacteriocin/lantibiotic exporter with double-glycine peptidase domain